MGRARVDELTAERKSLRARTKRARADSDTLAARTRKQDVAAAIGNKELVVVARAVQSLKASVAASRIARNTTWHRGLRNVGQDL